MASEIRTARAVFAVILVMGIILALFIIRAVRSTVGNFSDFRESCRSVVAMETMVLYYYAEDMVISNVLSTWSVTTFAC